MRILTWCDRQVRCGIWTAGSKDYIACLVRESSNLDCKRGFTFTAR